MNTYTTEKEQIELLKDLWKKYGMPLVLGIVVASLGIFAWRYWHRYEQRIVAQGSLLYEQMLVNVANDDNKAAIQTGKEVLKLYSRTPYAGAAGLLLAKIEVGQKQYQAAYTHLTWVMDHSKVMPLQAIARLRAARVLIQMKKETQALAVVNGLKDKAFLAAADEIKGDIYSQQQKPKQAKAAYQNALSALPDKEVSRPLLEIKLENLGGQIPDTLQKKMIG